MSVKIYINESDDEKTKLGKVEKAATDYGKELYAKCHQSSQCSEESKKYITTSMCHNFAYSELIQTLLVLPINQEVEIQINPRHVTHITKFAEKRLQQEKLKNIASHSLSK